MSSEFPKWFVEAAFFGNWDTMRAGTVGLALLLLSLQCGAMPAPTCDSSKTAEAKVADVPEAFLPAYDGARRLGLDIATPTSSPVSSAPHPDARRLVRSYPGTYLKEGYNYTCENAEDPSTHATFFCARNTWPAARRV